MSPMSADQPVTLGQLTTALARFHRDVILPDVQRVVQEVVTESEKRLESRLMDHIDGLAHKVVNLETEVRMGFSGVDTKMVEIKDQVDVLSGRVDVLTGRVDVLTGRVDDVADELRGLKQRLNAPS